MDNQIQICNNCGTPMKLKEKEGSKFWGCPNYKEKGCKTLPYGNQIKGWREKLAEKKSERNDEVMNALRELWIKVDNIQKFLISNLGEQDNSGL